MARSGNRQARPKAPRVLVFGEDANDTEAIKELFRALRPTAPVPKTVRGPLVLVKDREPAGIAQNAEDAGRAVARAAGVRYDVKLVIAHQDCDKVEPAHLPLAREIEAAWGGVLDAPVIGVAPAWETEAWFYLWPDAVAAVNNSWKALSRQPRNAGMIQDAKEQLRRDLRPGGGARVDDYSESDAPRIAAKIRERGEVNTPAAGVTSGSFDEFKRKVLAAVL